MADAEAIALHKDHETLVKYPSGDDEDFRTVVGHLRLMVKDAVAAIEQRWDQNRPRGTPTTPIRCCLC